MKKIHIKKLNYTEYNYIKESKMDITIFDYCKHGDLFTTTKVFIYEDKRNLCLKCAEEAQKQTNNIENTFDNNRAINILKNPRNKISKEKLFLWYPFLYKKINGIQANSWNQKVYMYINNIFIIPKCVCGNNIAFDTKKNIFKKQCEKCNRSKAVKKALDISSRKLWNDILIENFNIKNPDFSITTKYLIINTSKGIIKIKKYLVHHLKKYGVLSPDFISNMDEELYLNNFNNNWELYKLLTEEQTKLRYPFIWKLLDNNRKKYNIIKFNEIKYFIRHGFQRPKCLLCNNFTTFSKSNQRYNTNCEKHKFNVFTSKYETEIKNFISTYIKNELILNTRQFGKELDIYIPDLNLAIEFNGLYWHSLKNNSYHYEKMIMCENNNIQLISIWEDDWVNKKDIIKSILLNKLKLSNKIYARKCIIKDVIFKDAKQFLNENHLQNNCVSSINLGLYYENKLVSLMTFGSRKISGKSQYELLRFCNKINYSVVGGASKLFKYFLKEYNPNQIISYANCDISNGSLYEILGFKKIGHTGINYWWVKNNIKYHRSNFMKHKLVKEGFDKNKTESEIMCENKYYKLYGAGNLKYEYKKRPI